MRVAAGAEVERLRASFWQLARVECAQRSPLSARICAAVAGDDGVLALVMHAPAHQRRPTLLLAAIHDLLLAGVGDELAAHVPTVAAGRAATGDAGKLALRFCRAHSDELTQILETRATQTNEVNRCAALAPALVHATPAGRPLLLVELGASAGLNLLVDRFTCCYRGPGAAGVGAGGWPSASLSSATSSTPTVICDCALDGELPATIAAPPTIAERVGIDLHPVDLGDPVARRWLLACTWPDEADRIARLRAALQLARHDPPTVLRGDALALLPELVGRAGDGRHPVVWHSWVLAYWTPAAQRELAGAIDVLGAERDLTWIYFEQPSETPGLPTPTAAGASHDPNDSALIAVSYRNGTRTIERLADADPHVHRMRWLAPQRGAWT